MCNTTGIMDKYIKNRSMVVHTIPYKYRIHDLLQTFGDQKVEKVILGCLILELNLSYAQLKDKLFARIGQYDRKHTFSHGEINIALQVINRFRPFRRQLTLAQLYHPNIKIGS